MARLSQELSLHARAALHSCGELVRAIGEAGEEYDDLARAMAEDAVKGLERECAKIRQVIAKHQAKLARP